MQQIPQPVEDCRRSTCRGGEKVKVRSCAQHLTCIPFPRGPLTHTIPFTAPEVALRALTAGPVPALNGGPSPTQRRQDHQGHPCVRPGRCNQTQPLCRRKRITDQAPCSHTEDDAGAQKMPAASTHRALGRKGGGRCPLPPVPGNVSHSRHVH